MEKLKTICLILPGGLPVPNIKGGAIETLVTLLLDQNEAQNKVHFVVISAWFDGIDNVSKQYKNSEFYYFKIRSGIWKKGINFVNYVISRTTGIIDFFKTPMHYDIEKIIKKINADYIVVEHGVYKHFGFLSKYYRRDQLYLHLHGTGPMPDRETMKTFGHFITVSEYVKKLYIKGFTKYKGKVHVCLNGIDDLNFRKKITKNERRRIRELFGVENDDLMVIYCGRLVHEKGIKELIRAILDTKNFHIKLMIIGSSNFKDAKKTNYVKEIESLVKDHENQIFFTGYVPNEQLYQYYQSADIQCVCSIYEEAAGLVVVEGMMSGIPQIITDSGGIREYADPACSICIKKFDSLHNKKDGIRLSAQITKELNGMYDHFCKDKEHLGFAKANTDKFDSLHFYNRFLKLF